MRRKVACRRAPYEGGHSRSGSVGPSHATCVAAMAACVETGGTADVMDLEKYLNAATATFKKVLKNKRHCAAKRQRGRDAEKKVQTRRRKRHTSMWTIRSARHILLREDAGDKYFFLDKCMRSGTEPTTLPSLRGATELAVRPTCTSIAAFLSTPPASAGWTAGPPRGNGFVHGDDLALSSYTAMVDALDAVCTGGEAVQMAKWYRWPWDTEREKWPSAKNGPPS